jgi:hypothetical protein
MSRTNGARVHARLLRILDVLGVAGPLPLPRTGLGVQADHCPRPRGATGSPQLIVRVVLDLHIDAGAFGPAAEAHRWRPAVRVALYRLLVAPAVTQLDFRSRARLPVLLPVGQYRA